MNKDCIIQGDFLLRHYDSGACRGKLGHSRSSVILHRAQVVGIFAMFGVLLVVASPLILLLSPVILCCKCRYSPNLIIDKKQFTQNNFRKLKKSSETGA